MRSKGNGRGLTLVETLIAMSILAFALSGVLATFLMNQRTVTAGNNLEWATHRARGVMEDLFSHAYGNADISVGTHTVDANCRYYVTETNSVKSFKVILTWSNVAQRSGASLTLVSRMSRAIHQ